MIKQRITKLGKLTILIAIRQLYFLARNWYLLLSQPYGTIKEIKDKQDKSQIVLIGLSLFTPILVYIAGRIIWDLANYGRILWLTGNALKVILIIQAGVLAYIVFFVLKVLTKDK